MLQPKTDGPVKGRIADLLTELERIKGEIISIIKPLPENPRITVLCDKPKCYVLNFSQLGDNWTAEYHSFDTQYQHIIKLIENSHLDNILPKIKNIVETGVYLSPTTRGYYNRVRFHPDVINNLKRLFFGENPT